MQQESLTHSFSSLNNIKKPQISNENFETSSLIAFKKQKKIFFPV